jgi:single-strand DNA-binding protein
MLNSCHFIGNLGSDPEPRYTPDGTAVVNVSMACNETWKDKEGVKKQRTEWIKLVFWGRLAEIVGEYLSKGSQIYVEGKLQTREWDDKDGIKRYTTEVRCSQMIMLGGGQDKPKGNVVGEVPRPDDDDIPF